MKRYVGEAAGTFILVFIGTGAIIVDSVTNVFGQAGIALAFGLAVLIAVYSFGGVSGAHINPAVTISLAAVGKFKKKIVPYYVVSQLIGAVLASLSWVVIAGNYGRISYYGATIPNQVFGWEASFLAEFVMTFILMLAVGVACAGPRSLSGAVIGSAVALDALFGGAISGASMNPARSFAPALVSMKFGYQWIYWVAPLAGALAGALAWKYIKTNGNGCACKCC